MGYSLPAAIGAAIRAPHRQIICFIGDGGLQINLQELQTIRQYGLNIKLFVFNNSGYGIIKQFQDSIYKAVTKRRDTDMECRILLNLRPLMISNTTS